MKVESITKVPAMNGAIITLVLDGVQCRLQFFVGLNALRNM